MSGDIAEETGTTTSPGHLDWSQDKPVCVPRQLAKLLQLSVEECADFGAMLGISAEEVRGFCVWRNAPTRAELAGQVLERQAARVLYRGKVESQVAPGVMEQYARSPTLPPLSSRRKRARGTVRASAWSCRRNGLANEGCRTLALWAAATRQSCLNLLPCMGPGWYPKVSLAAMLDMGVCRWDHIVSGISAKEPRQRSDAADGRRLA